MNFKTALGFSVVLHISLFAMVVFFPGADWGNETTYYVDLIHFNSGSGPGNRSGASSGAEKAAEPDAAVIEQRSGSVRDLSVSSKSSSRLRYPDKQGRKKEEKPLVSVKRREPQTTVKRREASTAASDSPADDQVLSAGLSGGKGDGTAGGWGDGRGGFGSRFPYAYYIDTMRDKISNAWYSSLVSPGIRGRFHTIVMFKIFRDGKISKVEWERRSGIETLDLSAVRAIENAAPFPPLPRDFPYDFLIVHFKFDWEK